MISEHKQRIFHRDIKSANILVTRDNVIKIGDWGMAKTFNKDAKMTSGNNVVTLWYRAPELLCGAKYYGPEVDM